MLRNKYIEEEIWRLKNQDRPIIKENTVPPNLIDTPIDQRNLKDERIFRLASESAAEEAEMEFNSLLEEFREWKKKNEGTFKDFLKDNKDDVKVIKISKILADRKVAAATEAQQEEAKRLWQLELKKMELDPYYIPDLIDPEEIEISKRKSIPRKLLAYKYGASSQQEEDLIGRHVDDWTNAINKGELDPSVDFMQYINMILGRDSVSRGGIISVI